MERRPDRPENGPYLLFTLALSLFALLALALNRLMPLSEETRAILHYADFAVCFLFFIDFLISFYRAENRTRYMLRWGWLDLLSSIPAIEAFRWGRAARIFRILRVLRAIRATKALAAVILNRRAEGAFLAASLLSLLLIVTSAVAVLQFETSPEANIQSAEDALWWAITTVTTVGYGDRYPVSFEGRIIAGFLMTAGVGLFGAFSGFVASWLLQPGEAREEADIRQLLREIRELREAVERNAQPSSATPGH